MDFLIFNGHLDKALFFDRQKAQPQTTHLDTKHNESIYSDTLVQYLSVIMMMMMME